MNFRRTSLHLRAGTASWLPLRMLAGVYCEGIE